MPPFLTRIRPATLTRTMTLLTSRSLHRPLSTSSSAATETRSQKLDRIATQLLDLDPSERHDYGILFRLKLGLDRHGPAVAEFNPALATDSGGGAAASADAKSAVEKTGFDIKLEKFDATAKIKIIKEVRTFTDLGLKEAKELVDKAPAVLKQGVAKEEAETIAAKLRELGATIVLE